MKTVLTHLVAFICGTLLLPLLVFAVITIFPNQLIRSMERFNTSHVRFVPNRGILDLAKARTESDRFHALGPAAKESFESGDYRNAKIYADELAALTPKFKGDWNYGNAIQDSNVVLGRIALRGGDTATAITCLQNAGKSPGSPQINSFGPNVSLARDLLAKGQAQPVMEYLTACKLFWNMDYGKTDDWIAEIKQGNTPDFGANLVY